MTCSCDTNILFHSLVAGPHQAAAARFLESQSEPGDFVLCELALTELYVLLRNPGLSGKPATAAEAIERTQMLRSNPAWRVVDYPGDLMDEVWRIAAQSQFPRRAIYDARLAVTLRHFGVEAFATRNVRHFEGYGFARVWDPLDEPAGNGTTN